LKLGRPSLRWSPLLGGLSPPTGARLTDGPGLPPSGLSCDPGVFRNKEIPAAPLVCPSLLSPRERPGGLSVSTVGPWAHVHDPERANAMNHAIEETSSRSNQELFRGWPMLLTTPRDGLVTATPQPSVRLGASVSPLITRLEYRFAGFSWFNRFLITR
jgi:hypothetical protein